MEVVDNRKGGAFDKIKENRYIKKMKGIKNIKLLAVILIIAASLIIYSSVIGKQQKKPQEGSAVSGTVMDSEEQKLSSILSGIAGAGQVEVMITRRGEEIVGVLVVAEGAKDIMVLMKLLDATTTALSVNKNIVDVYSKK
ncbi:MAG: hypothetical protein RR338_05365 [Clostridia bacterium]